MSGAPPTRGTPLSRGPFDLLLFHRERSAAATTLDVMKDAVLGVPLITFILAQGGLDLMRTLSIFGAAYSRCFTHNSTALAWTGCYCTFEPCVDLAGYRIFFISRNFGTTIGLFHNKDEFYWLWLWTVRAFRIVYTETLICAGYNTFPQWGWGLWAFAGRKGLFLPAPRPRKQPILSILLISSSCPLLFRSNIALFPF